MREKLKVFVPNDDGKSTQRECRIQSWVKKTGSVNVMDVRQIQEEMAAGTLKT